MEKPVSYRHNVLNVDSIDTFLSVKGGFHNNCRDVYFVRAIGECEGFAQKILEADKKMGLEMERSRLFYLRVKKLPVLREQEDIAYYMAAYEDLREGRAAAFRALALTEGLKAVLSHALLQMLQKYQCSKAHCSESMAQNFAVKALYWLDAVMGDALSGWTERKCVKILAENVVKEQEYLFFYFVTLLGCDVLLLEHSKDVEAAPLKELSQTLSLGALGMTELCQYVGPAPQKADPKKKMPLQDKAFGAMPSRSGKAGVAAWPEGMGAYARPPRERGAEGGEKSFEELAGLASSIVMIAVHDAAGKVLGTGSGIMIGQDGYLLTNHHVVAGGSFFSVRIEEDERIYNTEEVIKYNSLLDLAILRIQRALQPLPVYGGGVKLARGQRVVAIGSPLGLFNSVSDGIISGFRNIGDVDMLQFTAPTSPGSSGGAVLNLQGEVIGISTAGMERGQNINLAVQYEDIRRFAKGFF